MANAASAEVVLTANTAGFIASMNKARSVFEDVRRTFGRGSFLKEALEIGAGGGAVAAVTMLADRATEFAKETKDAVKEYATLKTSVAAMADKAAAAAPVFGAIYKFGRELNPFISTIADETERAAKAAEHLRDAMKARGAANDVIRGMQQRARAEDVARVGDPFQKRSLESGAQFDADMRAVNDLVIKGKEAAAAGNTAIYDEMIHAASAMEKQAREQKAQRDRIIDGDARNADWWRKIAEQNDIQQEIWEKADRDREEHSNAIVRHAAAIADTQRRIEANFTKEAERVKEEAEKHIDRVAQAFGRNLTEKVGPPGLAGGASGYAATQAAALSHLKPEWKFTPEEAQQKARDDVAKQDQFLQKLRLMLQDLLPKDVVKKVFG